MAKHRAIPQGYMTVGEVAKKIGVTVRTLQYYDKEGLLSPSAESEGGRRLYTDKDLVILHQIISLKSLGFSLNDIKHRLISLETPSDVANALTEQADSIRKKIEQLTATLTAIEQLREEVLQMQTVNFKKYADIIVNLQMKNDSYYLIKRFDDDTLDHIRNRFDKESGLDFMDRFHRLSDEIIELQKASVPPENEKCQRVVKEYWGLIMEFTNGDMSMLPNFPMLNALGIKEIEKKQYVQLSTGQKRRLHLALALIGNPDIIFLDEPTAGLDVEGRVSLHEQIRKLKSQGKTIVLASHDMAEVENLCDRIAILNNGNIAFCGTVTELTDKIGEKYFIHIKTQQGNSTFETDNIEDILISLLNELKQKEIHILDIKVDRGTLEQHFIEMARRETE